MPLKDLTRWLIAGGVPELERERAPVANVPNWLIDLKLSLDHLERLRLRLAQDSAFANPSVRTSQPQG